MLHSICVYFSVDCLLSASACVLMAYVLLASVLCLLVAVVLPPASSRECALNIICTIIDKMSLAIETSTCCMHGNKFNAFYFS